MDHRYESRALVLSICQQCWPALAYKYYLLSNVLPVSCAGQLVLPQLCQLVWHTLMPPQLSHVLLHRYYTCKLYQCVSWYSIWILLLLASVVGVHLFSFQSYSSINWCALSSSFSQILEGIFQLSTELDKMILNFTALTLGSGIFSILKFYSVSGRKKNSYKMYMHDIKHVHFLRCIIFISNWTRKK